MKKAGIIIIGLALAIFVSGHFFIFKLSQNSHQNQFRAFIFKNLDKVIKVDISPFELYSSSSKIKWLDDNKEVVIDNQIYDVVGLKNSGKTVSLFLMNDNQEKNLIDNYNELASSVLNTPTSSKTNLIKDFLSLKFLQDSPLGVPTAITDCVSQHSNYLSDLTSVFISLENPPPVLPKF